MLTRIMTGILLTLLVAALPAAALAEEAAAPTADEQMAGLEAMCAASSDARAERHMASPLYERLGGYDRILELTTEIVRLYGINPAINRTLEGVDEAMLAKHVADFMAAGTGGTAKYTGRDLPSSHAHLKLTNADFLSAGGDVIQAMTNLKYGQDEIDEVVCILVSLKGQVVFE